MYVIAYDIGTTGLKTGLYRIARGDKIRLIASEKGNYDLYMLDNGGVEQDPNQWWSAMKTSTKKLLESNDIKANDVKGISFCAQMQAVVLVDKDGEPVRNAMSYMDNRAQEQIDKVLHRGVQVAGMNANILLTSLKLTGAVSASVKDPVWRYRWVADNEPRIYSRIYKWLDAKDYLALKATGKFTMSEDSAFGTLLYDTRQGQKKFSKKICDMLNVDINHLPDIIHSTDMVGGLTGKAANELGLDEGTPVFSGGGDASLIGVGAGAVDIGDTHVYIGTSGWVGTVIDKQKLDVGTMIASIVGVNPASYNCFGELDTAGKCFEWARHNIYDDKVTYEEIGEKISKVPAGSNGIIFTPWLHGNRCPFEDPNARGMFFGLGIESTREDMYRAVVEGVCLHLRWQMESMNKLIQSSETIRFAGGGARTDAIAQILSDVLGKKVEVIANPQDAGAAGAAAIMAVGLGEIGSIYDIKPMIHVNRTFIPNAVSKNIYDKVFEVFQDLYKNNKRNFLRIGGLR